ncbi:DUF4135 domain-containing protein [Helicobacter pylori]|nr:DUF4135 domain-containing protein [Helicobacter pylori]
MNRDTEPNRLRLYKTLFNNWFNLEEIVFIEKYIPRYRYILFRRMEFFLVPTIAKLIFCAKQNKIPNAYGYYFNNTKVIINKLHEIGILDRVRSNLINFTILTKNTIEKSVEALLLSKIISCKNDIKRIEIEFSDLHSLDFTSILATIKENRKFFIKSSLTDPSKVFYDVCKILNIHAKKKSVYWQSDLLNIADYIEYNPNVKDIELFYKRVAELMAVSATLNLTDIHLENLLISDGLPIILDFETLFTFKETYSGTIDNTITDIEATLFIEPIQELINNNTSDNKRRSIISGLQGGEVRNKSFLYPFVINDGSNEFRVSYRKLSHYQSHNRILYNKNIVKPHFYTKIITNSFKETMLKIYKNKQKLLDVLNENYLSNFKYRHILRPTSFYSFISVRSWQPKEYNDWDTYWNKISLTLNNKQVNCFSENIKEQIIQYEIQTIQKGLVPLFYRDINTCNLYTADLQIIKNAFKKPLIECIKNKISQISNEYIYQNVLSIKESLRLSGSINQEEKNIGWIP